MTHLPSKVEVAQRCANTLGRGRNLARGFDVTKSISPKMSPKEYRKAYYQKQMADPAMQERKKMQDAAQHSQAGFIAYCERYNIPESKVCADCGERKPRHEYRFYYRNTDGLLSYCKPCQRSRGTRNHRQRKLHRKYGISPFEYEQLVAIQRGVCAVCKNPEAVSHSPYGKTSELSVDHDHSTGEVRGLLCTACNHLLGKAYDDPRILQAAIDYLVNPPILALYRGGR